MKRREFITLLGGTAVTPSLPCSRAADAQQVRKGFRIGLLGNSTGSLESRVVDAFRQRLRNLGYVEGENIAIEYRWAEGENNRLPKLANELVRLKPDVIVATGTPGILAVKRATNTIPIVFA